MRAKSPKSKLKSKRSESYGPQIALAVVLMAAWAGSGPVIESMRAKAESESRDRSIAARNGVVSLIGWTHQVRTKPDAGTAPARYNYNLNGRLVQVSTSSLLDRAWHLRLEHVSQLECRVLADIVSGKLPINDVIIPSSIVVQGRGQRAVTLTDAEACPEDVRTDQAGVGNGSATNIVTLGYRLER